MRIRGLLWLVALLLLTVLVPQPGLAQNSPSRTALEAAIRRELEDIDAASARFDQPAVLAHMADGEGMFYTPELGRLGTQRTKDLWGQEIDRSARAKEKLEFEITKLYVLPLGPDTALANYIETIKTTADGKTEVIQLAYTDIFVLQNGRWLLRAEHSDVLPKKVEATVAGLPTDWKRSTNSTAASYSAAVDTAVHHGGKASSSLRYNCGSDAWPWTSLNQAIDPAMYVGKRVRLSGWIKTADSGGAGGFGCVLTASGRWLPLTIYRTVL